jgi:hypothetical protein
MPTRNPLILFAILITVFSFTLEASSLKTVSFKTKGEIDAKKNRSVAPPRWNFKKLKRYFVLPHLKTEPAFDCDDNDTNLDPHIRGVARRDNLVLGWDRCIDNTRIEQVYCGEDGIAHYRSSECPRGEFCNSHAEHINGARCQTRDRADDRQRMGPVEPVNVSPAEPVNVSPRYHLPHNILPAISIKFDPDEETPIAIPSGRESLPNDPTPADRQACEEASEENTPAGFHFWDYGDEQHISTCINDRLARFIICGPDGHVSITESSCHGPVGCHDGVCGGDPGLPILCSESDGGLREDLQGNIEIRRAGGSLIRQYRDHCRNHLTVVEYYCPDRNHSNHEVISCNAGQACLNGACVDTNEDDVFTCEEDDDGRDLLNRGESFEFLNGEELLHRRDLCQDGLLLEYFCDEETQALEFERVSCEEQGAACQDGACIPGRSSCVDMDANNPDHASFVRTGIERDGFITFEDHPDTCYHDWAVREQICNGDVIGHAEIVQCAPGTHCEEGACVNGCRQECQDSDPDNDVSTLGIVTNERCEEQPDICVGQSVRQFDCEDGEAIPLEAQACPDGQHCDNGACVD